jgi:hypothetical protein
MRITFAVAAFLIFLALALAFIVHILSRRAVPPKERQPQKPLRESI